MYIKYLFLSPLSEINSGLGQQNMTLIFSMFLHTTPLQHPPMHQQKPEEESIAAAHSFHIPPVGRLVMFQVGFHVLSDLFCDHSGWFWLEQQHLHIISNLRWWTSDSQLTTHGCRVADLFTEALIVKMVLDEDPEQIS